MAKHTPGPWKARDGFMRRAEVFPVRKVAIGQPCEVAEISDTYDEWKANAILIAASPDLLKFARWCVSKRFDSREIAARALAVIRKATEAAS